MQYKERDERKVIHGHSTSGGMNNASIQQQQAFGVELVGRVTDPDDGDALFAIVLNKKYFDKKEEKYVTPIKCYDDKIMISDFRSCPLEYAKMYWETVNE